MFSRFAGPLRDRLINYRQFMYQNKLVSRLGKSVLPKSSDFLSKVSFISRNLQNIKVALALLPGVLFFSLGLALIFAPQLLVILFAAFLVCFGITVSWAGYRIYQLKKKLASFSAQIEARLILDPSKMQSSGIKAENIVQYGDSKKVIYH